MIRRAGNVFQWQVLGTPIDENSMSQYLIRFPASSIFFHRKSTINILDSDYKNYLVVYMCQNEGETG